MRTSCEIPKLNTITNIEVIEATMAEELYQALKAYITYRHLKKELHAKHKETSPELIDAYQKFVNHVPKDRDPVKLLMHWEDCFNEVEVMFFHQGG